MGTTHPQGTGAPPSTPQLVDRESSGAEHQTPTPRLLRRALGKVYGNQHGTWVEFRSPLAEKVVLASTLLGITPSEFLDRALDEYIKNHHPDYKRWVA